MHTTCRYRHTKIGGLPDLIDVVSSSATVNVAQAVGSMDGTVIRLDNLPGRAHWQVCRIKSFHHLRFSESNKGHVFVRSKSDSPEVDVKLLKDDWNPDHTELPERIMPSGLTLNRQWYLHNKIREFCPDECKDLTCPEATEPEDTPPQGTSVPTGPATATSTSIPETTTTTPATASTTGELGEPRAKWPRLCGICRKDTMHESVQRKCDFFTYLYLYVSLAHTRAKLFCLFYCTHPPPPPPPPLLNLSHCTVHCFSPTPHPQSV